MVTQKKSSTKKKSGSKSKAGKKPTKTRTLAAKADVDTTETASDKPTRKVSKPAGPARPGLISGTYIAPHGELARWRLVDATGIALGRLSSYVAQMLMGKDKPEYTRSSDAGDFVIVINAEKVLLTGKKATDKLYQYHTNFPGGLKTFTAKQLLATHPERIIESAVHGMLPSGHMGRRWYKKLRVFAGSNHPHAAQQPQVVKLPNLGSTERA